MNAPASRFRVVIADDLADVRFLVRAKLEESPWFEVVGEAADGREAAEQASRHRPDLLVLDLSMPGMDGLQALPLIVDASPSTKVVVLSSFSARRMESVARGRGAVGYIEKSLSQRQLVDQLLEVSGLIEAVQDALTRAGVALNADSRSPSLARRFVDETLRRWDCGDLLDSVSLLVSELVTNAVIHAGSDVEVSVALLPNAVRVEVLDHDPTMPVARDAADDDTSGRGMAILDALASAWGMDPAEGGKVVWFELPRLDPAAR